MLRKPFTSLNRPIIGLSIGGLSIVGLFLLLLLGCSPLGKDKEEAFVPPSSPKISVRAEQSCSDFLADPINDPTTPADVLDRAGMLRWLEKSSRLLRAGKVLTRANGIDDLAKKTRAEVVARWMKEPAFGDTVVDFNLFLWGAKLDRLKTAQGIYNEDILDEPLSVIAAAQAVVKGSDYLDQLLNPTPPFFPSDAQPAYAERPEDELLTSSERVDVISARILSEVDDLIKDWKQKLPASDAEFCDTIQRRLYTSHLQHFDYLGAGSLSYYGPTSNDEDWYYGPFAEGQVCSRTRDNTRLSVDPLAYAQKIRMKDVQFLNSFKRVVPLNQVPWLKDLPQFQLSDFGIENRKVSPIGFSHVYRQLRNSSTNMNRRRANFFLKRFFCDNLTPINVEIPTQHGGGRHASEASCQACHYRLDPMAGFFASYGSGFQDFSKKKEIIFDDGATADRVKYFENWQDPLDGKWNVGYIRSPSHPELNSYGTSLNDLFRIMREAPEVRSCIVQRMFEYFVGPEQTIDAGYLDYATKEFNCVSEKQNSTEAFKRTINRIVHSKSFTVANPSSDLCYDYPPGSSAGDSPPCQVAAVLQKNCVACHDSTGADGGLDLSRWIKLGSGEMNFPHLNRAGQQRSQKESFSRMVDRLSTTDDSRRMPLDKYMHPLDREKLFLWANTVLGAEP